MQVTAPIDGGEGEPRVPGHPIVPPSDFDPVERQPTPPPSPPINVQPNPPPTSITPGTTSGVIISVDNANSPKYAMVALNNDLPPVLCIFASPVGPFAAGGTAGYTYFYNNSSGVGGSWCSVLTNSPNGNMITSVSAQVSQSAPVAIYGAITNHKHSGGPNADGVQDPQPINLGASESQNTLPYLQHALPIQGVINSTGKILSTIFSGAFVDSDGSVINADGATTEQLFNLVSGQVFSVGTDILNGNPGTKTSGILLGSTTNGYGLVWDTTNKQYLVKYVNGVATTLSSTQTVTQDNNYHSFRLSITPGSPNTLEGSIGTNTFTATDTSLNLTASSWYITALTG